MQETERIVIENNILRIERITPIGESPLESLQDLLVTRLPIHLPILPHNIRYVTYDPDTRAGVLMVEREPKRYTLNIATERGGSTTPYNLQLPYQYFIYQYSAASDPEVSTTLTDFYVERSMLMWRPTTFRTYNDPFWNARIPNVDQNAIICWGNTITEATSLSAKIDAMTNSFDQTEFNPDLRLRTPFGEGRFDQWQTESENPTAYLAWNYWADCEDFEKIDLARIVSRLTGNDPIPPSIMDPSFVTIPDAPANFTIRRAQEWYNSLNEGQQNRLRVALNGTGDLDV